MLQQHGVNLAGTPPFTWQTTRPVLAGMLQHKPLEHLRLYDVGTQAKGASSASSALDSVLLKASMLREVLSIVDLFACKLDITALCTCAKDQFTTYTLVAVQVMGGEVL